MQSPKFNKFRVILVDDTEYKIKTYSKMTERYCGLLSYRLVNKRYGIQVYRYDRR